MSRGPLPSQICLLSGLPYRNIRDKVRFIGCVISYSMAKACLQLRHEYPEKTMVTAMVDVNMLLETIGHEQTRAGEWVNVMGYVTAESHKRPPGPRTEESVIHVQALMVWSTGPLDIKEYEKTFLEDSEPVNNDSKKSLV